MLGGSICSQLSLWMRVTPETRNALTTRLNSVTTTLSEALSERSLPSQMARSTSGTTLSRKLKVPSTQGWGVCGISVTFGSRMISRTLATLTP